MAQQDRSVVLVVVIALACIALAVVGAACYLAAVGKQLPDSIVVMGATAGGALAGVLATTSTRPSANQQPQTTVHVHGEPVDPEQPAA